MTRKLVATDGRKTLQLTRRSSKAGNWNAEYAVTSSCGKKTKPEDSTGYRPTAITSSVSVAYQDGGRSMTPTQCFRLHALQDGRRNTTPTQCAEPRLRSPSRLLCGSMPRSYQMRKKGIISAFSLRQGFRLRPHNYRSSRNHLPLDPSNIFTKSELGTPCVSSLIIKLLHRRLQLGKQLNQTWNIVYFMHHQCSSSNPRGCRNSSRISVGNSALPRIERSTGSKKTGDRFNGVLSDIQDEKIKKIRRCNTQKKEDSMVRQRNKENTPCGAAKDLLIRNGAARKQKKTSDARKQHKGKLRGVTKKTKKNHTGATKKLKRSNSDIQNNKTTFFL